MRRRFAFFWWVSFDPPRLCPRRGWVSHGGVAAALFLLRLGCRVPDLRRVGRDLRCLTTSCVRQETFSELSFSEFSQTGDVLDFFGLLLDFVLVVAVVGVCVWSSCVWSRLVKRVASLGL